MRLSEFIAFIEGLEYGFRGDAPSPEQWQLIKNKLHQVRGEAQVGQVPYFGHEPVPECPPFYPFTPATDIISRKVTDE